MSLLLNICKYNNCGLVFPNLNQLIQHIEEEHINFDAGYVEKLEMAKPAALPLSYVLPSNIELQENCESDEELDRHSSSALSESELPNSNSGVVPVSDEISHISESADANVDDEVNPDDTFTFDFIMRYGSKRSVNQTDDKPFVCPMPECTKRYKNVNGLRYHARNGHKKNIKPAKKYECYCGRGYKTVQGLRAHAMALHNIALILPNSSSLQRNGTDETVSLLTLANMPNYAFEQIHDVNVGGNAYELKSGSSTAVDTLAEMDLSAALTDETCLNIALGFQHTKAESNLSFECAVMESVFDEKLEHDENSSTTSSYAWQEMSDCDEKSVQTKVVHAKSELLDDDEIDVGDANDTIYPYYH